MKQLGFIKVLIGLSVLIVLLHISIILKIIPYDIVWGGRIKNDAEMYKFEVMSIFINLFFIFVLLVKGGLIKLQINKILINIILWIFFTLFLLNTIGNLLSKTVFEKCFALVTLIFIFCIFKILKPSK